MNPLTAPGGTAIRPWLGLALLSYIFAPGAAVKAQAPVITNPGDLRTLSVNTIFRPSDPDPAWSVMAPMPTARVAFATAAANGKVYVIGGAVVANCGTVATVEAYDPERDIWISGLAAMPPPLRFRPSGATLDNTIYVVGGATDTLTCNDTALNTVQAYDPATDIWSEKTPMPTARLQVGLGVDSANHLLYAVGGAVADRGRTPLDTVEVYDPATDSWTIKQHLNTARGAPAVAAVNGKIYAIGGQSEFFGTVDSVEEFDPALGTWTTKPSVMPHPRVHSAAAIVNGKVYIMGGRILGEGIISTIDVYDPTLDAWTAVASLPTARELLGAGVVANRIYAVGGDAVVARVGEPFTYQITATNNPTSYDAFPLPNGLSIDRERGVISGIPTTFDGSFILTFVATNGSGSDSREVSYHIASPPSLPEFESIVSSTCVTGRAGKPFTFQVLTNNASSEAKLSATGLPYKQTTIDPGTGLISGIVAPTLDGSSRTFGVGIKLTGGDASQSYLELTFVSNPLFPVVTSSSKAALIPNKFFTYTITADAVTTSVDYIGLDGMLDGLLPAGLSYDPATATISGFFPGDAAPGVLKKSASVSQYTEERNGIKTIKKEPPPKIQTLVRQEQIGTGTAPLNFIIGLHDFEAEALSAKTSERTDYVIFTNDLLTSGGAAGLLKSTKVGDYVDYTIPVNRSGTYDVKLGIRTDLNQGVFQLTIDGMKYGLPRDGYSPTLDYKVLDLGPVTFSEAGTKTFRLAITGRNSNSSGYQLVCDYFDLVPYFEAEGLPIEARSAPCVIVRDRNASGGYVRLLKATGPGDYVTYGVPIAEPAYYNIKAKAKTGSSLGVFQLFLDGKMQGYAQKGGSVLHDFGTIKIAKAGKKEFQFMVLEGGPDATDYSLAFDYLELVLASHLEAEKLSADSTTRLKRVVDANLSGRAGMLLKAEAPGNSVTYTVTIPSTGTYNVRAGIRKGNRNGIVQLSINGVDQGSPEDNYSAEVDYQVVDLGSVTFAEAGEKTFQFLVTGQNSNSEGYQFLLDYVDLVR